MSIYHNKKPLVIHIAATLDFGGVERHMETIARHSHGSSMRPIFCAIGNGGLIERQLHATGSEVICLGKSFRIPSFSAILALFMLFRRLRPMVVHTHGAEPNFHGLIAAWLAGVPVRVGEEIGIPDHSWKVRAVFRAVYGLAHRVIGVSQAVTESVVNSGEVPLRKARRLYCPTDLPEARQSYCNDGSVFRLVNVGRLEPSKQLGMLLDVLNNLRGAAIPAELWLIGDGSQRQMLEQKVREDGLTKSVVFHGYQAEPEKLVRQCDVFVLSCRTEGFGLALVEAMGCGVPGIGTAAGGPAEIIAHGVTGWLVPNIDERSLTDALISAYQAGPGKLQVMGQKARASVESRFRPETYITELESFYAGVISKAAESSIIGSDPRSDQ